MCTTELESERLVTYGAKPPHFLVPLAVPTISGAGLSGPEFRRKHGIPESAFVVLFISRFDLKKGLQLLIPALANAKRRYPQIWFLLAGTGEQSFVREVDRMLDEQGIRSWTTLPGFISGVEKKSAFAASNIFALPSLNENFGMVVVEALQNGVPALISDEVYLYPSLKRAGAAIICKPEVSSCQAGLESMIEGRVDLAELSRRGRILAEGEFSPSAATQCLIKAYKKILSKSQVIAG
jgi:glycosyltransferase involved in cell wall biosynthesis